MIALVLALALPQAAAAAPALPGRFQILVDPCASAKDDSGRDVVVCGRPEATNPRLPMRDMRGPPDHPVPSNPEMSGRVALNGPGGRGECGAYGEGCPVFGGGYVVPKLVSGAIDLAHHAFARRPDRRGRVAIDLDAPPPAIPAGALRP